MPPIMPPICCDIASSTLRCASLMAATIRSCNIWTSSFETTSGSSARESTCLLPLITTVTMPPPAVASTRSSAICFCRRSCICCACFIICSMFIVDPLQSLHILDLERYQLEQRLHPGIGGGFALQVLPGTGRRRALHIRALTRQRLLRRGRIHHRADDHHAGPGDEGGQRIEPRTVLLEIALQQLVSRREREHDSVAVHLDRVRLRHGHAVEADIRAPAHKLLK